MIAVSFKSEIYIILGTIGFLILLPLISIVVIANAGVSAVASEIASVNPVTHLVEIFDANGNKVKEMKLSTVWPTKGIVSDEFGTLEDFRANWGLGTHTGTDIAAIGGAPVTPFMDGTVVAIDNTDNSACGLSVTIDHGGGITSVYCHLSRTKASVGAEVQPGDIIGYVGTTGASTGNHVHFQINVNEIPVNTRTFMIGDPVQD